MIRTIIYSFLISLYVLAFAVLFSGCDMPEPVRQITEQPVESVTYNDAEVLEPARVEDSVTQTTIDKYVISLDTDTLRFDVNHKTIAKYAQNMEYYWNIRNIKALKTTYDASVRLNNENIKLANSMRIRSEYIYDNADLNIDVYAEAAAQGIAAVTLSNQMKQALINIRTEMRRKGYTLTFK